MSVSFDFVHQCCLHLTAVGSAFAVITFGATCVFAFATAWSLTLYSTGKVVGRLQYFGFPPYCYPSYRVSTISLAGLFPAEHFQPSLDIQRCVNLSIHTASIRRTLLPFLVSNGQTVLVLTQKCSESTVLPAFYDLSTF